ncbi:MAG: D-sedoheptulose-7-phosphate isomerase [Endozoicomonas sp.]
MSQDNNRQALFDLYPFLHNKKQDAASLNTALLESVRQKIAQHQSVIEVFFKKNDQAVIDAASAVAEMYRNNGRLYVMGNGGSSSDASHIAVEFLHPVTTGRPALPAYDLSMDKTFITALGNDVGFDNIFSRQMISMVQPGDVVLGVSTSGNSKNLVQGFLQAKKLQAVTIGLTGGAGGEMATMGLDHCLVVESDSIHRTQECHVAIYHVLWDLVHTLLADDRGNVNVS